MDRPDPSKRAGSAANGRQKRCAECGQPLTEREQYLGDACGPCEREYLRDTHDLDDDLYPRAA